MNDRESDRLEQLWGKGAVRVFISHTSEYKLQAKDIQKYLAQDGIASFVAHEDIEPMKEWQNEIERALFSMDLLVALLTEKFSESDWTDQEIGVAVGRKVPIIPVRMGKDPYGFMGKCQAITDSTSSYQISNAISQCIFNHENFKSSATDAFIINLENSYGFGRSNYLARYLPKIVELSPEQEKRLVSAFNDNSQVHGAFAIRRVIIEHLKRITGHDYAINNDRLYRYPW